jgi:anti-sigma B factor antagonist
MRFRPPACRSRTRTLRGDGKGLARPSPSDDGALPARHKVALSIRTERKGDLYLLAVSGELDLATCEQLNDQLELAEASDATHTLLDLSDVTFIDSTGVQTLVTAAQRARANGGGLLLYPVAGQVRKVLQVTGLLERLNFLGRASSG